MESQLQSSPEAKAAEPELIFDNAFEALFGIALKNRLTPRMKERLRGIGVHLDRKLQPAYPRAVWAEALSITREEIFPFLPTPEGFRELGRTVLNGYAETLVGKALASIVRLIGPKRTLARMTKNLRSASNFNDTRFVDLGPTSAEIWVNEGIIHPEYVGGLLEGALRYAGATNPKISVLARDENGCTYSASW